MPLYGISILDSKINVNNIEILAGHSLFNSPELRVFSHVMKTEFFRKAVEVDTVMPSLEPIHTTTQVLGMSPAQGS